MNSIKSILAATLLAAGMLATAVQANPPFVRRIDQRPLFTAPIGNAATDSTSAKKFVQIVGIDEYWAVRNAHPRLAIEAIISIRVGPSRTVTESVIVDPGETKPYACMRDGAMGSILRAQVIFSAPDDRR